MRGRPRSPELTLLQKKILVLLYRDYNVTQIANKLNTQTSRVSFEVTCIQKKLNIHDSTGLRYPTAILKDMIRRYLESEVGK